MTSNAIGRAQISFVPFIAEFYYGMAEAVPSR
jgi:hypothetical protein